MTDILWTVVISVVVMGALLWGVIAFNEAECDEIMEETGRLTRYRVLSGCYVQVDGRWIPLGSWRGESDGAP